ncbi:L-histidine N(alpha)-methyltransferase [Cyanobium sp. Cruz CV13-4-11]|uniref:L-histidine N(alpha)-methyltransferase n=1 Tax=unclassified Cyanobium TaxID=2627006 RepID=UPI0020CE1D12|nr:MULTISPECIES: L-histidine N(alpha)-methyltransferase [unclassified Cyanobium]MCP9901215.1 L-histidine N(alpha)-methyltransferase [Cyanobium sp. Cruz CV11-17]MCP9920165.1 L-histidine N(alpha)-methyltransferase [Cyanobium sp. Cruz CV13-4-11]
MLIDLHPEPADMARLVIEGMGRQPKQLPAWLLYDAEGSRLFEAICEQPEYGLTRTETALLEARAAELAAALGPGVVVEFGAGSARKVSPLLGALQPAAYVALDISADHLAPACRALQRRHPDLPVLGICCDYSLLEQLPGHPALEGHGRLGFYPGSSIGNFDPAGAQALLRQFRRLLGAGSRVLIGIDQPKAVQRLEAAYNDAAGWSEAFARNLLTRLNRDLDGDFQATDFQYRAWWDADQGRIAMALVSQRDLEVRLADRCWPFAAGEPLITEYSYKYSPEAFLALAASAGWRGAGRWSDPAGDFALHLLVQADSEQHRSDR